MKKNLGNLVILGDSYSTYEGHIPDGYACYYRKNADEPSHQLDSVEETWWKRLLSAVEGKLLLNCSYSGSTVCNTGYGGVLCERTSFIGRAEDNVKDGKCRGEKVDTVLIFGCTNDNWANSPLGEITYGDFSPENKKALFPAYAYLLDYLRNTCPTARLVSIVNTELKGELVEGIKTISAHYGVQTIELSDIDKMDGHPTSKGMEQIAEQVLRAL